MATKAPPYIYENNSKSISFDAFGTSHIKHLRDSIKDTLANDISRMSRAFPTFRVLFIEEDSPQWGFRDDIYGYNSVKSISIYKSRKEAADTAVVEITNFKGVLDNKNFLDADHADTAEEHYDEKLVDGQEKQDEIKKMFIRPGLRVRIQLGYSSHDDDLDNTFTGVVTEVQYGDVVTFVAQGYGIELLHSAGLSFYESAKRKIWPNVKELVAGLLTSKKTLHLGRRGISNLTKKVTEGGEKSQKRSIFSNPIDDNIFLVSGSPLSYWADDERWIEQFRVYHTTVWEAMQDITRRFPGYIAAVVPFDDRGTFFFGLPDQPYFFTATEDNNTRRMFQIHQDKLGNVLDDGEPLSNVKDLNAKVFRSYHLKDSEHHIISNNIKISLENFYNKITVEFKRNPRKGKTQSFSLPADDTIKEKYIKEKVVFEQNCENKGQAASYAMSHLLLSTKELYDGELIILGDPSIKPHDTIMIADGYNDMYGPIEVREVVHNFDRENGFTTTIVPDLVVHINNPFKIAALIANSFRMNALSFAVATKWLAAPFLYPGAAVSTFLRSADPKHKLEKGLYSAVFGRSGWQDARREPIGISPLVYNDKPYIAGFEGMKSEDWITRKVDDWVEAWGEFKKGTRVVYNVLDEVLGGSLRGRP